MAVASPKDAEAMAKGRFSRMGKRGLARLKSDIMRLGNALSLEQFIRVVFLSMNRDEDGDALPDELSEDQELHLVQEYDQLDVDGSGALSWDEIASLVIGRGLREGVIKEYGATSNRFIRFKGCVDTGLHTTAISLVRHIKGSKTDRVAYSEQGSTILRFANVDLAPHSTLDTQAEEEDPCCILCLEYLPEWNTCVLGGSDMSLRFYDCRDLARSNLSTGQGDRARFRLRRKIVVPAAQRSICWSPSSQTLFTAGHDGCIYAWDVAAALASGGVADAIALRIKERGNSEQKFMGQQKSGVMDDGRVPVITLSIPKAAVGDQSLILSPQLPTPRSTPRPSVGQEDRAVTSLVELSDLGLIASCGLNQLIVLWDVHTGGRKRVLAGHTKAITCMAFSGNLSNTVNVCLVSGGFDYSILVWNPHYSDPLSAIRSHQAPVQAVEVLPSVPGLDDIHRVVSVDSMACIKVHDITTNQLLQSLPIPEISMLNDFTLIRTARSDGTPLIRAVACARQFRVFDLCTALAGHGEIVVIVQMQLIDWQDGRVKESYRMSSASPEPSRSVLHIHGLLLTASRSVVRSWRIDVDVALTLNSVIRHSSEVSCFCLGDRGLKVFIGDFRGGIAAYNLHTGSLLSCYSPHSHALSDLYYSPCGDRALLSVSSDNCVKVHAELEGEGVVYREPTVLRTASNLHLQPLTTVAFSQGRGLVAFGSVDAVVSVRSFESLGFVGHCVGHRSEITALSFLDPLALLVTADALGNVALWSLPPVREDFQFKCLYRFINMRTLGKTAAVTSIDFVLTGVGNSTCTFTASTPHEEWARTAATMREVDFLDPVGLSSEGRAIGGPERDQCTGRRDEDVKFFSTQPPDTDRSGRVSLSLVTGDEEGYVRWWDCDHFLHSEEILALGLHLPGFPARMAQRQRNPHWRGTSDGLEMAELAVSKARHLGWKITALLEGRRLIASERLWKAHEEGVSSVQIRAVGNSTRPVRPSKELVTESDLRYSEEGDHRLRDLLEKAKAITEAEPVEKARHRRSILQRLKQLKGPRERSQQPSQDCPELCRRS
ncbi:hypothetical protein FOZ63_033832 [Perkinsus olseni]|uniref:EF-hand domain-containing protein n=1 Tax=Perkinsus olseni TaxID=32597 RepID=A0A7J6S1A2_PEROL|nr:hypothetical protein FOZ63_033832 [Perkinsus olseni]